MRHFLFVLSFSVGLLSAECSGNSGGGPGPDGGRPPDGSVDGEVSLPDSGLEAGIDGGQAPEWFSVATWNLEQFPKTATTVDRVADLVTDLDLDLIAVQEIVDPVDLEMLGHALPDYEVVYADDPGAFIVVGFLYRTANVRVSEVETLFPDDWYAFPRPPLKAKIEVVDGLGGVSFDFIFMVLHLKAQLDQESVQRRREACEALETWISAELQAGGEQDFVVAGDWNDELTDAAPWNVFTAFLSLPETYTFLSLPPAQAGAYSYITFQSMIDHILVTSDVLDAYGDGITQVLPLDETEPGYVTNVSDHRPVVSVFHLR